VDPLEFFSQRKDLASYAKLIRYAPLYIAGQLELTSRCFQRCPMCSSWKEKTSDVWNLPLLQRLWDDLSSLSFFEHLALTGGDPQAFDLLERVACMPRCFRLQLTTALCKRPEPWYVNCFDQIRISLDSVSPEIYKKVRGVVRDPEEIFGWLGEFSWKPQQISFLLTISTQPSPDLLETISRIMNFALPHEWFRRIIVMCRIPSSSEILGKYARLSSVVLLPEKLSLAEDVAAVRKLAVSPEASQWQCWASIAGFHMKADGSVYPCCLVGGEAIRTAKRFCLGSYAGSDIRSIYEKALRFSSKQCYQSITCQRVCQFKQMALNCLVSQASDYKLSIP